jgi:ankyrin repeat protein
MTTLDTVLTASDQPDASICEEALAATTVIYAASHEPILKLPKEAADWVKKQGYSPSIAVMQKAVAAIEIILKDSELRDLWEESSSTKWQSETQKLQSNLQEALKRDIPKRQPKKLSAPRKLYKLIESISADDDSPLRKKLWERLNALEDVNKELDDYFEPPLCLIAKRGLIPEAKMLISKGANINLVSRHNQDPLRYAAQFGHVEMVRLLIDNGANLHKEIYVDADKKWVLYANEDKEKAIFFRYSPALWCAVSGGYITTIDTIISYGADIKISDILNGATLLHMAAMRGHPHVVEYLINQGLDVNHKRRDGATPLSLSANNETSMMLRKYGGKTRSEI